MTRTALELVCQSGLGHSFDTLEGDTAPHPYSIAVKTLMLVAVCPSDIDTFDLLTVQLSIDPKYPTPR